MKLNFSLQWVSEKTEICIVFECHVCYYSNILKFKTAEMTQN